MAWATAESTCAAVGYIESEGFCGAGILALEVGDLFRLARSGDDFAAGFEDLFGEQTAKAGGGSGDEPCARCVCEVVMS